MFPSVKTGRRALWRRSRADLAALALFAGFFAVFFWWLFWERKFTVSSDSLAYSLPLRTVAFGMIRDGAAPLWTPHVMSGYPLLGMIQLALGYPLTWGYLFLPNYWAEQVYLSAPMLLAPAFTYAFCREAGRTRLASALAGLAFTYSGVMIGVLSLYGYMSNGVMWLPLVLLATERARRGGRLAPCLALGGAAYAMSVLNGYPQAFIYAGMIAAAYGLWLSLFARAADADAPAVNSRTHAHAEAHAHAETHARADTHAHADTLEHAETRARDSRAPLLSLPRWKPAAVALGSVLLGLGAGAFQILETMRALRRSARVRLDSEMFFGDSPNLLPYELGSLVAPLYYWEIAAYLPPLALAAAAVALASRAARRDTRVLFWLAVSVAAWLLLPGVKSPVYRLLLALPIFRHLQVPMRFSFLWTFAVSVLAAYGLDALRARAAARTTDEDEAAALTDEADATRDTHATDDAPSFKNAAPTALAGDDAETARPSTSPARPPAATNLRPHVNLRRPLVLAAAALALSAACAVMWWRAISAAPHDATNPLVVGFVASSYARWKVVCTLLLFASLWQGLKIARPRARAALLAAAIVAGCFPEAYFVVRTHWGFFAKPAARYRAEAEATRYLRALPPEQNRAYTRVGLFVEENSERPLLDPPDLAALAGLHEAGGYEPLYLDRYSRALGGVLSDSVSPRHGSPPNFAILGARAHTLDLLNVTHLVTYSGLAVAPSLLVEKDGVRFADQTGAELRPGESAVFSAMGATGDRVELVSVLAGSVDVEQNEEVGRALIDAEGIDFEHVLNAGTHTAEWAHDSPDVRGKIKHARAHVFDSNAGDAANSFRSHRYLARLYLGRSAVHGVEIKNTARTATLHVSAATLYDSATRQSTPLARLAPERWQVAHESGPLLVLRNLRALPRAWLVAEAAAVDGEEALKMIRGESAREFDPRRTALLEVGPGELPPLPGGEARGRVTALAYRHNGIDIETETEAGGLLVVGEQVYPGWQATVDGEPAKIYTTNFVAQSVAVPPGSRRVELRYTAPAARNGAIISALSLLALAALALSPRARTRLRRLSNEPRSRRINL
jgi:Bacterial membrane protein YfhO